MKLFEINLQKPLSACYYSIEYRGLVNIKCIKFLGITADSATLFVKMFSLNEKNFLVDRNKVSKTDKRRPDLKVMRYFLHTL